MTHHQNKAIVHEYLEAVSGRDKPADLTDRYVTDEALKRHIEEAERSFPRYRLVIEDTIAEDDKVAVRLRLVGRHDGEFMGVPATHREIDVPGVVIYRLEGGKIAEHWLFLDSATMQRQLGAVREESVA